MLFTAASTMHAPGHSGRGQAAYNGMNKPTDEMKMFGQMARRSVNLSAPSTQSAPWRSHGPRRQIRRFARVRVTARLKQPSPQDDRKGQTWSAAMMEGPAMKKCDKGLRLPGPTKNALEMGKDPTRRTHPPSTLLAIVIPGNEE